MARQEEISWFPQLKWQLRVHRQQQENDSHNHRSEDFFCHKGLEHCQVDNSESRIVEFPLRVAPGQQHRDHIWV